MPYYLVGTGLVLMGTYGATRDVPWQINLLLAAAGAMVLVGIGPPLYAAAIRRASEQEIVCRFVPWFQSNTIAMTVLLPVVGFAAVAAGRGPSDSAWVSGAGWPILILGLVFALFSVLQCLNRLSLTPSLLTVRILQRRFEIPRERVVGLTPRSLTFTVPGRSPLHFDLVYAPEDGGKDRVLMFLDMQVSVETGNLAEALLAWTKADPAEAGLMDRIEAILRRGVNGAAAETAP